MAISKKIIDGKVSYEVFVKVRDNTGKQKGFRRCGINSEREAKRIEFDLKNSLLEVKSKIYWKELIGRFLDIYKLKYRNSTFVGYKFNFDKWINPEWNSRYIDEITTGDVHELIFEHVQGVSSHTRKNLIKMIKRVFQFAIEDNLLSRNPAAGIKVKLADANQKALNKNEIAIFLKAAKSVNHRFYNHWTLALLTGMRSGELQALRWTDVDFENSTISINKSWTRYNGEGPTKTARNRICPMSAECRKFLQELKMQTGKSEYVLSRQWEWAHGQLAQITKEFCKGLNISQITFHDLRATFITQMLRNGVSTSKVMSIVGHSSLRTTEGYLRLCGKDVEGATEALDISLPDVSAELAQVLELKRL